VGPTELANRNDTPRPNKNCLGGSTLKVLSASIARCVPRRNHIERDDAAMSVKQMNILQPCTP
jgi:hypothetical protein